MDYASILTESHEAAAAAQVGMVENMHALDCGFAWVKIDGSDPLARFCRKERKMLMERGGASTSEARQYGDKGYPTGWQFWCPGGAPVQAVGIHEVGAKAFALTLAEHGIRAEWSSRLD